MNANLIYAALAAAAGGCIALQATANGGFRKAIDSPWYAALFSICGTISSVVVFFAITRPTPPTWEALRDTNWYHWIGGPLGFLIVLAGAALVRPLGAAAFIALVVGGQLCVSMALDHFALMGLDEKPISVGKVIGALLIVGGVVCVKYL